MEDEPPPAPVATFTRDAWVFAVFRERARYRIEARHGAAEAQVICRMDATGVPEWYQVWSLISWQPWVQMKAHKLITAQDSR